MEEFLHRQGDRLNAEYAKIHNILETDLKKMYHSSFKKVADCFGRPGTLEVASACADKAREPIEAYNREMTESMGKLESHYKACLNRCKLGPKSTLTDELSSCVTRCTDESVQELSTSQGQFSDLARRFI